MQEDKTQGRVANENRWLDTLKYQGHLKMRLSKQKLSFSALPFVLNERLKITAKQITHVLMVYVWAIHLLHMLPPKQIKGKTKRSFPHKAQDKLTPST